MDADAQARAATEAALARRFGADYRVLTADAPQAGLDILQGLADRGEQVALVAADLHLGGVDGVEFLERAHLLHRDASRVLLAAMDRYHTRIPFSQLATLQRATALGRIDLFLVKGWVTPEEWLYPQVQEALGAWTMAHRPHHVVSAQPADLAADLGPFKAPRTLQANRQIRSLVLYVDLVGSRQDLG